MLVLIWDDFDIVGIIVVIVEVNIGNEVEEIELVDLMCD